MLVRNISMSIKQRLYPEADAEAVLRTHCDHSRFIYNLANEQRLILQQQRRYTSFNTQARELTEIRAEHEWLRNGSQQVQQSALRDNDQAWQNRYKNPKHFGQPTWRKAGQHDGFVVLRPRTKKLNRKWGAIKIQKLGWIKFRLTKPFVEIAAAKSARVKFKAGKWTISFTVIPREFQRESTGSIIGLDAGVAHTMTTSTGEYFDIPRLSPGKQKRLLVLQQQRAKTEKGSVRRKTINLKIAKLKGHEANKRKDWVEKTTTQLIRDHDIIGIEDLKINNMTKAPAPKPDPDNEGQFLPNGSAAKAGLNKAILEGCWGMFRTRLEQKAEISTPKQAATVIAVNPRNTSLQCRECHNVDKRNRKSQAEFFCVVCGHEAHADVNAALNIEDKAVSVLDGVEVKPLMFKRLIEALSSLNNSYAAGHAVNGRSEKKGLRTLNMVKTGETYEPVEYPESPSFR